MSLTKTMTFKKTMSAVALAAASTLALAGPAAAAILTGTIKTEAGKPVMGAMFTVWNAAQDRKETVYTDENGTFAIRTDFGGKLQVRARLANFADAFAEVDAGIDEAKSIDLVVKHFADAQEQSDALTASAHTAVLPGKDGAQRAPFVSQCNYCHQVGNALTRVPRDEAAWRGTVRRMEGYFAMLSKGDETRIIKALVAGFDGKPVNAVLNYGATPELAHAKVEQWLVGDEGSFIHDTDVGADDKLYGTDEGNDVIWVLDRKTSKIERYGIPSIGLPRGGKFSGMTLPIGIFTGEHGPHSMAQGKDGRIWVTNALSSTLMSFDPVTHAMKLYPVPGDALYPHTVRMGLDDTVWFTINASNQLGHFDPKTSKFTVVSLPHNGFWRWLTDMLLPTIMNGASWWREDNLPLAISHHRFFGNSVVGSAYGIDVNPLDGSIWVAQLYDHTIVRIDPKTYAMTTYHTPFKGPRRPRFDRSGILWIPAFDDGVLMRFDPKTASFENFRLPVLASNEYEVPYALNVDPKTQDIWITANASDRVIRFDPKTKTFMNYPSPTRTTVMRDIAFTSDGKACNSTSNLPAYGMEDGLDSFICFDPEGGARDRAEIAALGKGRP